MSTERSNIGIPELVWFKSSYSGTSGGECIEVAMEWRKSSRSTDTGGNCVEIATCPGAVHVRDSKEQAGATLAFASTTWTAFVSFAAGSSRR